MAKSTTQFIVNIISTLMLHDLSLCIKTLSKLVLLFFLLSKLIEIGVGVPTYQISINDHNLALSKN